MKENLEHIDLSREEIEALLERVERSDLPEEDYKTIKGLVDTVMILSQSVNEKAASIKRLVQRVFGSNSEKSENLFQPGPSSLPGKQGDSDQQDEDKNQSEDNSEEDKADTSNQRNSKNKKGGKNKGSGKNGKNDYTGADKKYIEHEDLKPGDDCPECEQGILYLKDPAVVVRITGNPPLTGTIYEKQSLRCNLCLAIFTAATPEGVGTEKYDEEAKCMIAILKYGSGFPFHRLDKLQDSLGVPVPDATQWDKVNEMHEHFIPVLDELVWQAAQGECLHNDDTTAKILELCKENNEKQPDRKGMFTTGMISLFGGHQIAIFATGRKHAGENMEDVLEHRQEDLPAPIQMCDALARNIPKNLRTVLANCLTHGRRQFVDILDNFPEECQYVIEQLAKVYRNDSQAKEQGLTDEQRLELHQRESAPVMQDLKEWLDQQQQEKKVEPNSGLGKAISYMLKHWDEFTLFLREPGVPLDNNICERALKTAILHRKNSMFYCSQHGAYVGDLFMSLIHTCELNGVNPFDYLITILKNSKEVQKVPQNWLPWNYKPPE